MRPLIFLFAIAYCFAAVPAASAQIGWTPQRMQKEYGPPTSKRGTSKLTKVEYRHVNKHSALMQQLGATDLNATYLDGKVVEIFLTPCNSLTKEQFAVIGREIVDASTGSRDIKWSASASEKGFLMIYCNGFNVGYFTTNGGSISASPIQGTPLDHALIEEKVKSY